jgi:hypothetical protein
MTGTVAGTVKLTANFKDGPSDIVVAMVDVPSMTPQMTNVEFTRTASGLEVQVSGYATSRRMTSVEFSFEVRSSSGRTQTIPILKNVESDFGNWYRNAVSTPFGGSFSMVQAFTVEGDTSAITGVTVRLTNAQGSTTSAMIRPR